MHVSPCEALHTPSPQAPGQGPPETGETAPSAAETRRSLLDALRGIDDEITFEEATRILDLLRQQQQRQPSSGAPGLPMGPDY